MYRKQGAAICLILYFPLCDLVILLIIVMYCANTSGLVNEQELININIVYNSIFALFDVKAMLWKTNLAASSPQYAAAQRVDALGHQIWELVAITMPKKYENS